MSQTHRSDRLAERCPGRAAACARSAIASCRGLLPASSLSAATAAVAEWGGPPAGWAPGAPLASVSPAAAWYAATCARGLLGF